MDVEVRNTVVQVRLSKRNLLSLLHKLEMPGSERTIMRVVENGLTLIVRAEEDELTYLQREPGVMHPETEAFIHDKVVRVKKAA